MVAQTSGCSSLKHFDRTEPVSLIRKHTFTTNALLYSDSNTGIRMANLPVRSVSTTNASENYDLSIFSGYKLDNDLHQEPIHEILIRDHSSHNDIDSTKVITSSDERTRE